MKSYLKDIVKNSGFIDKDGIIYFSGEHSDIRPSQDQEPQNSANWSYWRRSNYVFFKEELGRRPGDSILIDLGAGQSDFLDLTSNFKLCAVDFYPYRGIDVVCDFANGLPFRDGVADIVFLSNVLEHSPEPNDLLSECKRILKKGGIILGSVPFLIDIHQRPYDFYRYTDINLFYLLKKCGFSNSSVKPVLMLHMLLFTVLTKLFLALIRKTRFSENRIIQTVAVFAVRVLWKSARVVFKILSPIFAKSFQDPDMPLGYLFKAENV